MNAISRQSVKIYQKIIGKLSPGKFKNAILALFGMLLGGVLSKLGSKNVSIEPVEEDRQIEAQKTTIAAQEATMAKNKEQIERNRWSHRNGEKAMKKHREDLAKLNTSYQPQLHRNQENIDRLTLRVASLTEQRKEIEDSIKSTQLLLEDPQLKSNAQEKIKFLQLELKELEESKTDGKLRAKHESAQTTKSEIWRKNASMESLQSSNEELLLEIDESAKRERELIKIRDDLESSIIEKDKERGRLIARLNQFRQKLTTTRTTDEN